MWNKIELEQELNPHLLIALLAQLKQRPQPIMFSFQIKNEPKITYLINSETFNLYQSNIVTAAIQTQMWQWEDESK